VNNRSSDEREAADGYVLGEASCQSCGTRLPLFDGRRVSLTATVACSQGCWEQITGYCWPSEAEWAEEPTLA
jgi:hypothetical protein